MCRITKKRSLSSILHPRALSRYVRRRSAATHPTCLSLSTHPSSPEIRHDVSTNRQQRTVAKYSRSLHPTVSRWGYSRPLQEKRDAARIQVPRAPLPPTRRSQPHRRGPQPQQANPRVTRRRRCTPPSASPMALRTLDLPTKSDEYPPFTKQIHAEITKWALYSIIYTSQVVHTTA